MQPRLFLSFQLNGQQEAAHRVGSPSKPQIGEPLPVSDSRAHVSPGGGDPDGMPTGGGWSTIPRNRPPLPHPALSPAPALVSMLCPGCSEGLAVSRTQLGSWIRLGGGSLLRGRDWRGSRGAEAAHHSPAPISRRRQAHPFPRASPPPPAAASQAPESRHPHLTPIGTATTKNNKIKQKIASVSKDVKKLEPSGVAGGNGSRAAAPESET